MLSFTRGADDGLVGVSVVVLVAVDPRPLGQVDRQCTDGHEIMEATGQEHERDKLPVVQTRCARGNFATYRKRGVHAPAEEISPFGHTVVTVGASLHRPTAQRASVCTREPACCQ